MKHIENTPPDEPTEDDTNPVTEEAEASSDKQSTRSRGGGLFLVFLLLILAGGVAAGGYFGWQWFEGYQSAQQARLDSLQSQLEQRPTAADIQSRLDAVNRRHQQRDTVISQLQEQQQGLTQSVQKLYDLYGRDENGWKLAEVEYLMSVAQHKLVLQNDFAGAAKTLDAANKRIAELADPGLLPVRSLISEEIALLKTRVRPDLAGMTLTLGRLTRQVASLDTVYVGDTEAKNSTPTRYAPDSTVGASELPLEQRARQFLTSLFTIKRVQTPAAPVGVVSIPEVKQTLEDNLKLTRWALLERDAMQYQRLMQANLRLFAEYFDPDDAANAEFHQELVDLSKTSLRPEIPDIGGSLRLLQQIQAKREQIEQAQEAEHG